MRALVALPCAGICAFAQELDMKLVLPAYAPGPVTQSATDFQR
jgi:hypothetical protein